MFTHMAGLCGPFISADFNDNTECLMLLYINNNALIDHTQFITENKTRKAPRMGANSSSVFVFNMHYK